LTTPPPEFPENQPVSTPANLASWGTRALGWLIDYLPVLIVEALLFRSVVVSSLFGVLGIAYWLYLGHLDGVTGQTPGKAMMGTRVVNATGELIGSGSGMARKVAHLIDGIVCGLGWLLPIVDAQRQTIADKVMGTYVVEGIEKKPFSVDLWMPPKPAA
jgi:uncharacterized RDD family membrane protein YckC